MKIVNMAIMADRRMPAIRAMLVRMVGMLLLSFPPPAADPQRMKRQSFSDVTRLLPSPFSC
jgi:hypothetical protein